MKRWLGLKDLAVDGVVATCDLVDRSALQTVGTIATVARTVPALAPTVDTIETVVTLSIRARTTIVRTVTRGVGGSVDIGHRLLAAPGPRAASDDLRPTPIRSDVIGSVPWVRDAALGAVNGVIGDYLESRDNGLALEMSLRDDGARVETTPTGLAKALPEATPRICVFVHGLATTDWSWSYDAEKRNGDPTVTYGSRLRADAGYTPLYLRYNTGRHISENGRELAALLEKLITAWPCEVESLVLIGHSMGGLVTRSACHYGAESGHRWTDALTHVYCIGSPHRGAALEKVGNVLSALLRRLPGPTPRIISEVLDARSAGIKDLRFGYVQDDEWKGQDPDALLHNNRRQTLPLGHVRVTYLSGAVGRTRAHWASRLIGDLLVRVPSAQDEGAVESRHVDAVTHVGLANDPRVYEHIRVTDQLLEPAP